jgi:hypothetical protein
LAVLDVLPCAPPGAASFVSVAPEAREDLDTAAGNGRISQSSRPLRRLLRR